MEAPENKRSVSAKMRIVGSSAHSLTERHHQEFYATNSNDVQVFLDQLSRDKITLSPKVWEPACGEGHIAKKLPGEVLATDLHDRGYGEVLDFFEASEIFAGDIITNPPYKGNIDIRFVRKAMELVEPGRYVMMLFKTIWQASKGRFLLFQEYPPKYIYNYSYRIKIHKNGDGKSNNALDYAWYIWQKGFQGETTTRFIPSPKWFGYENFTNGTVK